MGTKTATKRGAGVRLVPEATKPKAARQPVFLDWSVHANRLEIRVNDDTHAAERRSVTIDTQFDREVGGWAAGWGPLSVTFEAYRNGCDPLVSDTLEASMFRAEDVRALAVAFTELARQIDAARLRSVYIEKRSAE